MGKAISKCLGDWGIQKIFSITVDNASSNDVAVRHLKKKYNVARTSILGGRFFHVRCIAHVVNLVVSDGLKDMNTSIARVRGAVRYFRQSLTRLVKFKECAVSARVKNKCLLCLDVNTRWNSTFLMLDTTLKFQRAFVSFELCDNGYIPELIKSGDGVPDDRDWANVRRISRFLREFYDLTFSVSGTSYITTNAFLDSISDVYTTLIEWQNGDDVDLQSMAIRMKEKYDKYWGNTEKMNLVLFIAAILDPTKKLSYVEFTLLDMYPPTQASIMFSLVTQTMDELLSCYRNMLQPLARDVGEGGQ
ncbi:PREDICTED: zinc finger BED domain-containing protein RICESLEEPER 2-like [Theobroma cacao]|uniref:Zinc finger BED domain-containing protein RICESLEEPER 2-like n=1 Tax=Theobroma cacao TaxID=3641 RepID=A0AB32WSN6_THECC|nr:PREDICTED: zinc finger BED domain-containing protein RICESLEEPER 2-like [Theobroma cacao]